MAVTEKEKRNTPVFEVPYHMAEMAEQFSDNTPDLPFIEKFQVLLLKGLITPNDQGGFAYTEEGKKYRTLLYMG